MVAFQLYDLFSTVLVPDLRKLEHVAHHFATLFTALAGLAMPGGPYFCYYSVFFFGFTEISSVPLFAVDLFRQVPSLAEGKLGGALNEAARTAFALTFLPVRCLLFPWIMLFRFWPDMYNAHRADDIRCPGLTAVWMLLSSSFLTALQLFWGYKILRVVLKGNLTGSGAKGEKAQKEA